MARPKKDTKIVSFNIDLGVYQVLEEDSGRYGISKGAYISQLIMQKHLELIASSLIQKMTPEQIQLSLKDVNARSASEG